MRSSSCGSSAGMPAPTSRSRTWAGTFAKRASTAASSAPVRTRSASGRPPSATSSAWRRIDFPAPVSPVTTLSPGSSTSSSSSMSARSRTRSVRSIPAPALPDAPAELGAQHVVVDPVRRAHERDRRAPLAHLDHVAGGEPRALLPVDGEERVRLAPPDRDADHGARPQHHGAVRERVGRDGREEDDLHRRLDDRPADGQRVCRGAGRRRDDHAVGAVGGEREPVHRHPELDDAGDGAVRDDHVVQGPVAAANAPRPLEACGERHAAVELVAAGDHARQHGHRLGLDDRGQEAELAQVDAEDGDAGVGPPRDGEERSVTAQDDDQVGLARELILGARGRAGQVRLGVEQHAHAPAREPAEHPPRQAHRARAVTLHHQPDRPDARHRLPPPRGLPSTRPAPVPGKEPCARRKIMPRQPELFPRAPAPKTPTGRVPLAERMRPRRIDEFVGQQHLLGPGRVLRGVLEGGQVAPLTEEEVGAVVDRALADPEHGLGGARLTLAPEARAFLVAHAQGDARVALNTLELAARLARTRRTRTLDLGLLEEAAQQRALRYDKAGEEHYNVISAFIKSLRGGDPDAAVYWMMRMLEAGEDPLFVARRMVIFAAEDVGNAEPQALQVAVAVKDAVHFVGLPEGRIPLAQAATFLATCPKSNASYRAMLAAAEDVRQAGPLPVPLHLRNAPTPLMKGLR